MNATKGTNESQIFEKLSVLRESLAVHRKVIMELNSRLHVVLRPPEAPPDSAEDNQSPETGLAPLAVNLFELNLLVVDCTQQIQRMMINLEI